MFVGCSMWLTRSMITVLPAANRNVGPTYVLLYVACYTCLPATSTLAWSTFSVIFTLFVVVAFASGGSSNGRPSSMPRSCSSVDGGGTVVDVVDDVGPATVVVAAGCVFALEPEVPHAAATRTREVTMQARTQNDSQIIEPV